MNHVNETGKAERRNNISETTVVLTLHTHRHTCALCAQGGTCGEMETYCSPSPKQTHPLMYNTSSHSSHVK